MGAVTSDFQTVERASTAGCIYSSWEQSRPVTIVKVAENTAAVDPAIPAFAYGVEQYADGAFQAPTAAWSADTGWADFTLTPAAFGAAGAASVTHELLIPLDGVRVTEAAPQPAWTAESGGWKLTNLVCVNGGGAPVLTNAGTPVTVDLAAGTAALADLQIATTPEEAAITCTYTNTYSPASSLSIEKRINGDDADTAPGVTVVPGSLMTVEFLVTNTGESELTDVTVTDNVIPAASIVAPTTKTLAGGGTADFAGSLLPGESAVYTAQWPAPSAGVQHTNIAAATGTNPDTGDDVTSPEDPANAMGSRPAILLDKISVLEDANGNGYGDAGEVVTYTFEVSNTGTLDLAPVSITDPMFGLTGAACVDTLGVGETATCSTTAEYTITAEDIIAGTPIVNIATATGTVPGTDTTVADDDTEQVPVGPRR